MSVLISSSTLAKSRCTFQPQFKHLTSQGKTQLIFFSVVILRRHISTVEFSTRNRTNLKSADSENRKERVRIDCDLGHVPLDRTTYISVSGEVQILTFFFNTKNWKSKQLAIRNMANNERRRGDQDYTHRPTGIVIPLEELKPLTSGDEPNNELVIATSARNTNDIIGDGSKNNANINYTAKKNFSQGENAMVNFCYFNTDQF